MNCHTNLLSFTFALSLLVISAGCSSGSGNVKSVVNPSSGSTSPPMEVHVELREWSVTADKGMIPSGRISFRAVNRGTEDHELVILKTDLPAETLPLKNDKVDEAAAGRVMGEIEPFEPTTEKDLTLDLEPGSYVLFCNIVETENGESEGHYRMGMRTVFEVIEQAPR